MVHRGFLHVCDEHWVHAAEFSIVPSHTLPATLSGRWQITHKSNKVFESEILRRCLLPDDGTGFVAFAGNCDDDGCGGVDAASELLLVFGSVFLKSVDTLSAVCFRLSVIFLLKQEKQANHIKMYNSMRKSLEPEHIR